MPRFQPDDLLRIDAGNIAGAVQTRCRLDGIRIDDQYQRQVNDSRLVDGKPFPGLVRNACSDSGLHPRQEDMIRTLRHLNSSDCRSLYARASYPNWPRTFQGAL